MSHYLYRLYDATGDLLYVGQSKDPFTRFKSHKADSRHWIDDVARGRISVFPTREAAQSAEREAIRSEHPFWNVAGRWTHHLDWEPEQYVRWVRMLRLYPYAKDLMKQRITLAQIAYLTRFGSPMPSPMRSRRRRTA